MANPVASLGALHKCDMPDARGTHVEIPVFFLCGNKVKVPKMYGVVQWDMTLFLHRVPASAGQVPVPMTNPVQKGSLTVRFGGKPATRAKDMSYGGKISKGIPLIKIG